MDSNAPPRPARVDARLLGVLLLLAIAIHAWLIARAVAPARDGIGFIRYAVELEHAPWPEVMARHHQHPLYPLSVLAVSRPMQLLVGGATCTSMLLSAQLAAALAGVLLVVPMYYLGKMLFDRRVGFWSAALFQCLPVSARISADTLSDPLCLLFAAGALALGCAALRHGHARYFAGCGLCSGLAYLARPEGALPALTVGLVWLCMQATALRRPWRQVLLGATSLGLAAVLMAGPFVAATGRLTTKPTAQSMFQRADLHLRVNEGPPLAVAPVTVTMASSPALTASLLELAAETAQAFHYFSWIPALAGLWVFRSRFRSQPGAWVLVLVCGLLAILLLRMHNVAGYLSERHVQLIVLCGTFWTVAAMAALGDRLAARGPRWTATALLLALAASNLPALVKPQHANFQGHRRAGEWLATHTNASDQIVDPHDFACFFAGRVLRAESTPSRVQKRRSQSYLVTEQPARAPLHPSWDDWLARAREEGTVVFRCPMEAGGRRGQEVVVFAVPRR